MITTRMIAWTVTTRSRSIQAMIGTAGRLTVVVFLPLATGLATLVATGRVAIIIILRTH